MSGGTFGYSQYSIKDIYETIEYHLEVQGTETEYGGENPIFEPEVLKHLQDAIECLKKAYVYAQRVDRFLAGDDGNENFILRLNEELNEL
jgi:hypothetical protein